MKLALQNLGHAFFGRTVLENVDLLLAPGEVVALLGPSGCGKTTILQIAAGLVDPLRGRVQRHYDRHAVVFQEPRLLPWMNARDNIAYGLRVAGTGRKICHEIAEQRAHQVGLLTQDLEKFPIELSGGMRQRVAVARALAVNPDMIYFDEPFTAVDVGLKRILQNLMIEAAAREHFSALFVTHDPSEAVRVAHRLMLLPRRPGGPIAERIISGLPGQRSERAIFDLVESWSDDSAFRELFDGRENVH